MVSGSDWLILRSGLPDWFKEAAQLPEPNQLADLLGWGWLETFGCEARFVLG